MLQLALSLCDTVDAMSDPASTPEPPYYAVIFTSRLASGAEGYAELADRMESLARQQPGFLGIESAREENGFGITVSYWEDEAAIAGWRSHAEHQTAQDRGKAGWYADYEVRVSKVERAYGSTTHKD